MPHQQPNSHPSPARFAIMPEVLAGDTADVYFRRTAEVLRYLGLNPTVTVDVFPSSSGVLCGIREALEFLETTLGEQPAEIWAMGEGESIGPKEVALRITAPYLAFGLYETALLGILASSTGWASAARTCVDAAGPIPVVSFGARHVHPRVAPIMDYAAIVGGCTTGSTTAGARLAGTEPAGTMPHALILIVGDTVDAARAFDQIMPPDVPRSVLVDTFKDEAEESLRVAAALGSHLQSVRLDTPKERGRVTVDLVREVRARLDLAGFQHVGIFVTGGVTPDRIADFRRAGVAIVGFGVGSYIAGASPISFTADIKAIEGHPVAKRGRIPGPLPNPRLQRVCR